jgi:hypothetical protein
MHVVGVAIWRYVCPCPLAGYLASIAMLPFRRERPMQAKLVGKNEPENFLRLAGGPAYSAKVFC